MNGPQILQSWQSLQAAVSIYYSLIRQIRNDPVGLKYLQGCAKAYYPVAESTHRDGAGRTVHTLRHSDGKRVWTVTATEEEILEGACLTLEQLCAAAALEPGWLIRHVEEGLIPATGTMVTEWRFTSVHVTRARRMHEIERTYGGAVWRHGGRPAGGTGRLRSRVR
jgi:hypothetical protein